MLFFLSYSLATACLHYFDMASFNPGIMEGFTVLKNPRMPWFLNFSAWSLVSFSVHLSQVALLFLETLKERKKGKVKFGVST